MSILAASAIVHGQKSRASDIDLSGWKLTLPVDAAGETKGSPLEISPRQLSSGFSLADYFQPSPSGELVFWCPVTGATTNNSDYPRSELREVIEPDDDNVNWPLAGTHRLDARCRVIEVPSSQKVIIGQIHSFSGQARPLIKLQYNKGRIEALVKLSPKADEDQKFTFPSVALNTDFDYQIQLASHVLTIRVNGNSQSANLLEAGPGWAQETFYFKAGAYCQDNEGPGTEGARVAFSKLQVSHAAPCPLRGRSPILP